MTSRRRSEPDFCISNTSAYFSLRDVFGHAKLINHTKVTDESGLWAHVGNAETHHNLFVVMGSVHPLLPQRSFPPT